MTSLAADGASKERRAVFLAAKKLFPNVLIVIRDPAHAIRFAVQSLHQDEVFGEVWDELVVRGATRLSSRYSEHP